MAAFHRPKLRPLDEVVADASTVIVTEGVNNPTNMGVMLRTAAALGVHALLVDPSSCDPLARRTCRVSMGAVFAVPHTRLPDFPEGLEPLHQQGFTTIALTPDPAAEPPWIGTNFARHPSPGRPAAAAHSRYYGEYRSLQGSQQQLR